MTLFNLFVWLEPEKKAEKPSNVRNVRDSAKLQKYIREKRSKDRENEKKRQREAEQQREAIKKRLLALELERREAYVSFEIVQRTT